MSVSTALPFTREEVEVLLQNLDQLDAYEQAELMKIADALEERQIAQRCRDDLIAFVCHMQESYIVGAHHKVLARLLMDIANGIKDRLCVNIAPRHGKSQLGSIYYAAWFIGKFPDKKIMLVSHTADLAVDFGRKVRNLIATPEYQMIFPGVSLAADSKSAGRWSTNRGGEFFATGVGSSLAGRGADLLLIDDPHSEQDVLAGNFEVFDKAYDWFAFGARTRLMPAGRIVIIQCMTGDTRVLMEDGAEKRLDCIRPGDRVLGYEAGALIPTEVTNWRSSGIDAVYKVQTRSGIILRANERHPFLVDVKGVRTWVRLKNLKVGDSLVSLKGACGIHGRQLNGGNAEPASHGEAGTRSTPTRRTSLWGTTVNGKIKHAWRWVAAPLRTATHCAQPTTTRGFGTPGATAQNLNSLEPDTLSTGTASLWQSMMGYWTSKAADVLSACSCRVQEILGVTGGESCASITATTQGESGGYSATTATSPWVTQRPPPPLGRLPGTSRFTADDIVSITPDGREEVFDVEVERTENFIANGAVVSNTRWHMDDLTGRVVKDMANPKADQYEVVEFPAILEIPDPETGEITEKALWPEFFDLEALHRTKNSMPVFQWNAQYQQNPTGEEGAIVKREYWRIWKKDEPPTCDYIIMTLDAAAEANNRADFTALTTWGVFYNEEEQMNNLILLNAIKRRIEFPELKELAYKEYTFWEPDAFIVEKKSSGTPLYQEMRRTGVLVQEYTPTRGTASNPNNKTARLNSVAGMIKEGICWVPETRWAEEVVEETASFPNGSNDDLVDTVIMALMRFRQGGFITLPSDARDEDGKFKPRRGGYY